MDTSFLGTHEKETELIYGSSKLYVYLESEVIAEILLMLRGIGGFIYTKDVAHRTFSVNHKVVVTHLTPLILFQQLQNFAKFGNHILDISHFYTSHLLPPSSFASFSTSPSPSPSPSLPSPPLSNPILQALAAALREYCECFYVYLSNLGTKCDTLTLLELESVLAPKRRDIEILSQVLRKMGVFSANSDQVNGAVLGTLYDSACEMSLLGDAQGMGIILHLLVKTSRPYFDALGAWLEEGKLPFNGAHWFMVTKNEKPADNSGRNGKFAENSGPDSASEDFLDNSKTKSGKVGGNTTRTWEDGYTLRPERTPNFLQPIANQILVAGKSIVLLREIFANFSQNHEKTLEQQKINVYVIGPAPVSLFEQFLQEVLEYFPQRPDTGRKREHAQPAKFVARIKLDLDGDLGDSLTVPFLGADFSFSGQEISPFLPHPDFLHGNPDQPPEHPEVTRLFAPQGLPSLPKNFNGNFHKFSPLPENSFTLQPISVIMQKGVVERIIERYQEGSQKLIHHLHEICLLRQNLVNLRAFFLMEAGFAFHQFTLSLFEKVDRGEILGIYELNSILQYSLICAGSRESYYPYRHLLYLELPEITPSTHPSGKLPPKNSANSSNLQNVQTTNASQTTNTEKNTNALDFEPYTLPSLSAVYQVPAPLDIIITPATLARYSSIFSFLLVVKRCKCAVESTIQIGQKNNPFTPSFSPSPHSSPRPSLHSLHLLRAKLMHFVNNLQHYLFDRVLQTGWDEFMEGVASASDLDDLVQKHATYVNKIFSQCLLGVKASPVLSVIKRILDMALRFSRNFLQYENYREVSATDSLQSSTNSLNTSAVLDSVLQEFSTIDTAVSQQVSLLVSILQDIVAQKNLPHLMDLLLRLNYNQYYRPF